MSNLNIERPDGGYIHVPQEDQWMYRSYGEARPWVQLIPHDPLPPTEDTGPGPAVTSVDYDDQHCVKLDRWLGYELVVLERLSTEKLETIMKDFQALTDQERIRVWEPMIVELVDELRERMSGRTHQEPDPINLESPRLQDDWADQAPELPWNHNTDGFVTFQGAQGTDFTHINGTFTTAGTTFTQTPIQMRVNHATMPRNDVFAFTTTTARGTLLDAAIGTTILGA